MCCQKVFIQNPLSWELWKSKFGISGISLKYVRICKNHISRVISPCLYPTKTPHQLPDKPTPPFHPSRQPRPQPNLANQQLTCVPHDPKPSLFHTDVSPSNNHFILHSVLNGSTHIWVSQRISNSIFQKSGQQKRHSLPAASGLDNRSDRSCCLCPRPVLSKDQWLEEKEEKKTHSHQRSDLISF